MKKQMLLALLLAIGVGAAGCDGPEAPHEHSFGDWVKVDNNTHSRSCECGETERENHSWGEGEVTTPSTHTLVGVRTFTCSGCGATKTEDVPMLTEHVYGQWIDETPATCTEAGEKGHYHCTCGMNFDAQKEVITDLVIPAKEHNVTNAVETQKVDAGCETDGTKAYYKCPDCNVYFKDAELTEEIGDATALATWLAGEGKISAKGHNVAGAVETQKVDAGCETDGTKAYYKCPDCNVYFEDDALTTEIGDATALATWLAGDGKLSAKGHDAANAVHTSKVDKTCDTSGTKEYYKCPDCSLYFKDADLTEKIGDDASLATWLAGDGKLAAGHEYQSVAEVAPTYGAKGVAAHYTCSGCDKLFVSDGQGGYTEKTATELEIDNPIDAAEINNFTYADGIELQSGEDSVNLGLKLVGQSAVYSNVTWLSEFEGKTGVEKLVGYNGSSNASTTTYYYNIVRPIHERSVYEQYDTVKVTYYVSDMTHIAAIDVMDLNVKGLGAGKWNTVELPMERYLAAFDKSTYADATGTETGGLLMHVKFNNATPNTEIYVDSVVACNKYAKTVMIEDFNTTNCTNTYCNNNNNASITLSYVDKFNGHCSIGKLTTASNYDWVNLKIVSEISTAEAVEGCDAVIVRVYIPSDMISFSLGGTAITSFTKEAWNDLEFPITAFTEHLSDYATPGAAVLSNKHAKNNTGVLYFDSIFAAKKLAA